MLLQQRARQGKAETESPNLGVLAKLAELQKDLSHVRDMVIGNHREMNGRIDVLRQDIQQVRLRPPAA